jgi:hypothetical protein
MKPLDLACSNKTHVSTLKLFHSLYGVCFFAPCTHGILGKRPSFIWRSFLAARDLLSHGITWRIGDGNSIKIWGDRWLPKMGPMCYSFGSVLSPDAKVSDLIDVSSKGWKCSLIDSSFPAYIANMIKNIPLCPSLPPDKIIWDGTSNGVFSVRSAYHLGWDLLQSKKGECSSSSNRSVF